jgi:hypothetical protein
LAIIEIVLICCIGFPFVSNLTFISPVSPTPIGSFGQSGTVQPHEAVALSITSGDFPVFVNSNIWFTISPSFTLPKSNSVLSIVKTGFGELSFIFFGFDARDTLSFIGRFSTVFPDSSDATLLSRKFLNTSS